MSQPAKDEEREERIHTEVVVDAYGPDTFDFPFSARCVALRRTSPLEIGETIKVVGMASDEECLHEMLVLIPWKRRKLAVPLNQLEGIDLQEETQQAIDDWHYWVKQGYEF